MSVSSPFSGLVTVAVDLINRLIPCQTQHWRAGRESVLAAFAPTGKDEMIPSRLFIKDRPRPVEGEVYWLRAALDQSHDFTDSRTGTRCRSRENFRLRLYPSRPHMPEQIFGELRFFTCSLEGEPQFSPAPVWLAKTDGAKIRGVWWVAASGVDYRVSAEAQQDVVLFAGTVLVQLGALPERRIAGAVAMEIANRISVYDRRKDRLSSFARAEHIRRTIGEGRHAHTFEFINLRDVATGEVVQSGGPERVLTAAGLVAVEEVEG